MPQPIQGFVSRLVPTFLLAVMQYDMQYNIGPDARSSLIHWFTVLLKVGLTNKNLINTFWTQCQCLSADQILSGAALNGETVVCGSRGTVSVKL